MARILRRCAQATVNMQLQKYDNKSKTDVSKNNESKDDECEDKV